MKEKMFYTSVTRISDLAAGAFDVEPRSKSTWATGDYVVAEVVSPPGPLTRIEMPTGRMVEIFRGDLVVGAFGDRRATLEAVGSWESVGEDGRMESLTSAGLFGRAESVSTLLPSLMSLRYRGHVIRAGEKVAMRDFVPDVAVQPYDRRTLLIIGTSMSSGKTTAAKVIIHEASRAGLRVVGLKLTGAARYRDILSMKDAGAEAAFDFVDVGLPSTVCPAAYFRSAAEILLALAAASKPDLVVVEAGASPLEPYNGDVALELLREHIQCTVLCASDPYAVVGVIRGFDIQPDLVGGVATSTSAGVALVEKLTKVPALNLLDRDERLRLREILRSKLGLAL